MLKRPTRYQTGMHSTICGEICLILFVLMCFDIVLFGQCMFVSTTHQTQCLGVHLLFQTLSKTLLLQTKLPSLHRIWLFESGNYILTLPKTGEGRTGGGWRG